ncbi:MAG: VWA domain-containing protein [Ignavibacteriae bacterium]|nr:MAG: VWA domain-containing protein [Ignavibacteriota bacterium]
MSAPSCFFGLPIVLAFLLLAAVPSAQAQIDSLDKAKKSAEDARIKTSLEGLRMTIQNVEITKFPLVKLIVEVYDDSARIMEQVDPKTLTVVENGVPKPVIGIEKIDITDRIPVDFVFLVDITGTMQAYINGVKNNIEKFVDTLRTRGIEYRLGLILFSDIIEQVYQPTSDVREFNGWLSKVFASGGFDEKENALEAIREASRTKWNPAANRVLVMVTDAPYHQFGEKGNGRTYMTTETTIDLLKEQQIRLFAIASPDLDDYKTLSESTRGAVYDIRQPFSRVLDQYSTQLTNLYALSYRSDSKVLSDSINVSIMDEQKNELVKQLIPIVEIGRKFIIENLLFPTAKAELPPAVEELEVLITFMQSRPAVRIRIEGHTDNTGSAKTNELLSQKRAEAVKAYVVQKGIDPRRIQTMGYGPSKPIGDNRTEFGRSLNRRTEIVITAK